MKHHLSLTLSLLLILGLSACYSTSKQNQASSPPEGAPQELQMQAPAPLAKTRRNTLKPTTSEAVAQDKEKDTLAPLRSPAQPANTEAYDRIQENPFLEVLKNPLSTFSIDVDTASYSNVRRFLSQGQQPPKDAVRIEELINYFQYAYPEPQGEHPFSLVTELATCPWNPQHQLLQVGLQARRLNLKQTPPNNLVFLLDVSGSMEDENKLPLLKKSLRLLVNELREEDTVSIVVYAGAAGLVLPPTSGAQKAQIIDALENLQAGGSTAGSAGIQLAYETARKHLRKDGNNRVILATDGDFNVGPSSDGELLRMIEEKRRQGIFLTVLGFGMGNYKDAKMEKLADAGNGNYAYIDSLLEAKKVLVQQLGGTLLTLAKDVKLQLEFNPTQVAQYRLIGYENRLLRAEDFDDDSKDAGELGAGHSVTALYELIPAGKGPSSPQDLRYQQTQIRPEALNNNELLSLKLRYKKPNQEQSLLLSRTVTASHSPLSASSPDFRFAAAVAGFGMVLRDSAYKGQWSLQDSQKLAAGALGEDAQGYRKEFLKLLEQAQKVQQKAS